MSDDSTPDYEVGYGKPPRHSQFQKGRSGNPSGRPKRQPTLLEDVDDVLQRRVTVIVGDKPKKVTMRKALVIRQVTEAVKGNQQAAKQVTGWMTEIDRQPRKSARTQEQRVDAFIKHLDYATLMGLRQAAAKLAREQEPTDDSEG